MLFKITKYHAILFGVSMSTIEKNILHSFNSNQVGHGLQVILDMHYDLDDEWLTEILTENFSKIIKVCQTWADKKAWRLLLKFYKIVNDLGLHQSELDQLVVNNKDNLIKSALLDIKENLPLSALEKSKMLEKFNWPELAIIKKTAGNMIAKTPESYLHEGKASVDEKVNDFKEFILFCKKQLKLKTLPKIKWLAKQDNSTGNHPTFGTFNNNDKTITVALNGRHPLDVMRTLAHELCHYRQLLKNELNAKSGETGSPQENEANAMAGIIMRKWGKHRQDMFNDKPIEKVNEGFLRMANWLKGLVHAIRSNNKREASAELTNLIEGQDWDIGSILDGLQDYADDIDVIDFIYTQKPVFLKQLLYMVKHLDEVDWPEKWDLIAKNIQDIRAYGVRWPELTIIEKAFKKDKLIIESESFDDIKTIILDWLSEHTYKGVEEALQWVRTYEEYGGNLSKLGQDIMPALEKDKKVIESFLDKRAIFLQFSSLDSYVSLLRALGVNWTGLEVPDIMDRNKAEVMRQILTNIKQEQHIDLDSILYTKSFGADWPELDILEKSARSDTLIKEEWDKEKHEAEIIDTIKADPYYIKHITNPSEKVQIAAVKRNSGTIEFIKNPSEAVQLAAVENDGYAAGSIKNPTEKAQLAAVKNDPAAIAVIDKPCKAAILTSMLTIIKNGNFGYYEDLYNIFKMRHPEWAEWAVIDKALNFTGKELDESNENISVILNTASEEKQIEVVTRYGGAIQYIKNPSEAVQMAAVQEDGLSIHYIENPSKAVQLAALEEDGRAIKYIKNPSEEIQLAAVRQSGWAIDYIEHPASKAVVLTAMLKMFKDGDFDLESFGRGFYDTYRSRYPDWPEWAQLDKAMNKSELKESAESNEPVPQEVHDFIQTLTSEDTGKQRIGEYVIHYEGFSEWCQQDAEQRTQLPPTDPRHLATYDDVYKEVLKDFVEREGTEPIESGIAGDELFPVYYAVFRKPLLTEADLNRINQYHEDGASLEGYVVDTDQPQIENYLSGQGASAELIQTLKQKYHRVGIVRNMWVDEEIRNHGIGTDMLKDAIGDAFAFGADAIILVADMAESNAMPLDKWYESFGFVTVGTAAGDPVMVLEKGVITESWSKKYKKSIDCKHPKGFSQKAHCAGRKARQSGKKTKSKSVSEQKLTEVRDAFLAYVKRKFPKMPDYVARDLIYKNSKNFPKDVAGVWTQYYGRYNWKLVKDFAVNDKVWDTETLERINRNMKSADDNLYPNNKKRFMQQRKMVQQRGISSEPIIVEESREEQGKYTLLEGLHRTVETLRANPQGYICPAYVGSPTTTSNEIRTKKPESFWQKIKRQVIGESLLNESRDVDRIVDNFRNGFIGDALTELTYAVFREAISPYEEMIIETVNGRKTEIVKYLLGLLKNDTMTMANVKYMALPSIRALKMLGINWPELSIIKKALDTGDDDLDENFADGKGPGRPGDSQRHGIPKGATIAQLEKAAKAPGRKGQLARWQLNMRRGRAKNESQDFFTGSKFGDDKGNSWSVEDVLKFAKSNPKYFHKNFPLSKIKHDLSWWQGDEERMKNADTSYPLLVLQEPDGHLSVADGLNRMKKAVDVEGKKTIDVYLVPKKDIEHLVLINESKNIIDGQKMLEIYNHMHHEPSSNPEMNEFVKSHSWKLTQVKPNTIPSMEELFDIDDPFDRVIDIDENLVKIYINKIQSGKKIEPVIMGPNNSVIDGNHRALAYKELDQQIPAYVPDAPTTKIKESKLLDKPTPTIGNLAEKYHTSLLAVKQELAKGIKVEMEHTSKRTVAREIALDHLREDLYYYKKLAKIEKNK